MPGKGNSNLPYDLENMSIPEMEALLQQDFIAPNGDAPDVDYIMAITEVIQRKEKETPDYQPVDTEQAWNEFQTYYNTETGRKHSLYQPDEGEHSAERLVAPAKTKRKRYRKPLLVAAVIVLLIALTCIPVLGYASVLQMVAQLSYETFRFVPETPKVNGGDVSLVDESAAPAGHSYENMQEALEAYEIRTPVFPQLLSENFVQRELKVDEYTVSHRVEFYGRYENDSQVIAFSIIKCTVAGSGAYERNNETEPEVYNVNGTDYYIFENLDQTSIAWYSGNLECSIKGNLSLDKAKEMIDSIF